MNLYLFPLGRPSIPGMSSVDDLPYKLQACVSVVVDLHVEKLPIPNLHVWTI